MWSFHVASERGLSMNRIVVAMMLRMVASSPWRVSRFSIRSSSAPRDGKSRRASSLSLSGSPPLPCCPRQSASCQRSTSFGIPFSFRGKYPSPCMTPQIPSKSRNTCVLPLAFTVSRSVRGSGVVHVTGFSSLRRPSDLWKGLVHWVRPLEREPRSREPEVESGGS